MALLPHCYGQTRPRLAQLRNAQQIRIGGAGAGDTRAGTLVDSRQLNLGRWVCRGAWLTDPAEQLLPTICTDSVYGVTVPPGGIRIVRSALAYTAIGRAKLLEDPEWATWWELHKNDLPAPLVDPAAALVIDLLTHPRPVPAVP